jgi:hypothetical protein
MAIRCTDPSYRMQENERNAKATATSWSNPAYRTQENEKNAQAMATSCTNPAYRR